MAATHAPPRDRHILEHAQFRVTGQEAIPEPSQLEVAEHTNRPKWWTHPLGVPNPMLRSYKEPMET